MKVIIAGSRYFDDYEYLNKQVRYYLVRHLLNPDLEIVSGGCKGADLLGEHWANVHNVKVTRFEADWSQGKKAGPERNEKMARYASCLIAFWDGESRGTKNMIDLAVRYNLKIRILIIKKQ